MITRLLDLYVNSLKIAIQLDDGSKIFDHPLKILSLVRGGASLPKDLKIDVSSLIESLWLERRSVNEIRHLPKDFYVRLRITLVELTRGGDESVLKQYIHSFKELAQLRLRKILHLVSISPEALTSRDLLSKLTVEEEVLVKEVSELVRSWLSYVIGL